MKIKTIHSSPTAGDCKVSAGESEASEGEVLPRDHQQRHPTSLPAGTGNSQPV